MFAFHFPPRLLTHEDFVWKICSDFYNIFDSLLDRIVIYFGYRTIFVYRKYETSLVSLRTTVDLPSRYAKYW